MPSGSHRSRSELGEWPGPATRLPFVRVPSRELTANTCSDWGRSARRRSSAKPAAPRATVTGSCSNGKRPYLEAQPRQPRHHREGLPIEVVFQHGSLAARRPGAAAMRLLAQSAFVEEDDRAARGTRFFLMPGQVLLFHVRMASSLRSRARPVGRCGLHPSPTRIFHTWPSW